ncbi:MAG TPA: zinc ribbon domain-containing protein [Gemmatimonadales bacterium]|nr:zinc ribbon domain-containing protein [Gemmatimonadales bacterium]
MPTYEYVCPEGHAFELFQKMSDKPRAKCPVCGKPATRKISGGAGLVFKGSGFYITDYGKDGKGPRKPPSESAADAKSEPAKTESKSKPPSKADAPAPSKSRETK